MGGYGSSGAGNRTGRRTAVGGSRTTTARLRDANQFKNGREVSLDDKPPKEEFLALAENGKCWWCGGDKVFKSLAIHWAQYHGISSQEIKNYLELPKKYSFNSLETKELLREKAKRELLGKLGHERPGRSRETLSEYDKKNRSKISKINIQKMEKDKIAEQLKKANSVKSEKALELRKNQTHCCVICGNKVEWKMRERPRKTCSHNCFKKFLSEHFKKIRNKPGEQ